MKKLLAVAMMLLALGSGKVFADHVHNDSSTWTLHGWYLEPELDAFIPFNDDLDATLFIGGKLGYQWNEYLSLEIDTGWANMDLAGGIGDVTTVPVLFNVRLNVFPGVYVVDYYVFAGVGIGLNDIDVNIPGVEIDNSFAGQIGGGAEYHINEFLSAFLNVRVYFNNPDVNLPVLGEEDVELNAILVGGGIVWRF
jgi:opacity protein-like surface antigen